MRTGDSSHRRRNRRRPDASTIQKRTGGSDIDVSLDACIFLLPIFEERPLDELLRPAKPENISAARASPQPNGGACNNKEQPSTQWGLRRLHSGVAN